jgi:hypothetical protein
MEGLPPIFTWSFLLSSKSLQILLFCEFICNVAVDLQFLENTDHNSSKLRITEGVAFKGTVQQDGSGKN